MSKPQSLLSWIGSRLLLSFLSALAGWATGMIFFAALIFDTSLLGSTYKFDELLFIGIILGPYVLEIWLVALLPLSLLVPEKSFLWKPGSLILIGIFAGPLIVGVGNAIQLREGLFATTTPYSGWLTLAIPASIVSMATCATGTFLHRRFLKHPSRSASPISTFRAE
jgi:hypothetical protein